MIGVSGIQCMNWGCDKCLLQFFKRFLAVVGEIPWDVFPSVPCEWDYDFRVAINEMAIEIGKLKKRHYISDFLG